MPIDDDNNLVNRGSQTVSAAAAMDELTPPQYGEHQFDQLYNDIDPTGYITPAGGPSGMSTPFQSQSRSVSTDNLASLAGVASSDFAANMLQSRLHNLNMTSINRFTQDRSHPSNSADGQHEDGDASGTCFSASVSCGNHCCHSGHEGHQESSINSNTVSRRESEEDSVTSGSVTPQHIEYSAKSLAQVPSYTTALQSQTRTPVNDGLPTYQSATGNPPPTISLPQPPAQRNVYDNHRNILRRCS